MRKELMIKDVHYHIPNATAFELSPFKEGPVEISTYLRV